MKKDRMVLGLFVFFLFLPSQLFAHGVLGTVQNGGLAVTATYDTGEPMSYARVEISAPGAQLPFQSGRTDRNGRFCFFPDGAGTWLVVVDDEMGHRLGMDVPVDEHLVWKKSQDHQQALPTSFSYLR